jgi:hypothetical protein
MEESFNNIISRVEIDGVSNTDIFKTSKYNSSVVAKPYY